MYKLLDNSYFLFETSFVKLKIKNLVFENQLMMIFLCRLLYYYINLMLDNVRRNAWRLFCSELLPIHKLSNLRKGASTVI